MRCALCRQGEVSAEALQQQFALAFQSQASSLFLELAELLPSPQQRAQLLSAASRAEWIAPNEALGSRGELGVESGRGGADEGVSDGWRPLNLSVPAVADQPVGPLCAATNL